MKDASKGGGIISERGGDYFSESGGDIISESGGGLPRNLQMQSMEETMNDVSDVSAPFDLQQADRLLRTLAHPIRYRMTQLMLDCERTAVDFQEIIGINEGAAMQHLRVLKEAGIAETRRGRQTFYYFSRSAEAAALLTCIRQIAVL
ncbi:ArsR/SmtB family transcription factor [Rhizobium sp. Rhizsp82]|uniref:ArsR/SmtB family transcription factor n=1 Tax=Rhizobium sp. Rhizsp82 TaxID=3243057 RepID=UPI0039B5C6C5